MNKWTLIIIVILSFSCKKNPNEKFKKEQNNISTKQNKDSLEMNISDEKKTEVSPEVLFIMSFYKNYMFEYDKDEYNLKEIEIILNEYCSENFLKKYNSYEYLDYNPFINGQDYPDDFLKNLKVESSDKILENRFIIYQTYNGIDYELLQMEIIKKEGNFKINKLYTPDGSEMLSMQSDK